MNTVVKQWGNSAAVRLQSAVMQAARLRVDVRVEEGRIIEPIADDPFDLAVLLAGINDENQHELLETSGVAGGEPWQLP